MKRRSILFLTLYFLLFTSDRAYPQGAFSKWYFGDQAGLDFATNPPTTLTNSSMNTFEGCASIAGSSGDLFFYTDGISVWDQTHSVMANGNGLLGDGSSTQSGVIAPVPGQDSLYYIFTVDQGGYGGPSEGIHYSIVDMTQQGGLGEVTTKNVTIMSDSTTEKIVAVPRCDSSFWLVTHKFHTNEFYAFPVDASGVGSPVLSSVGSSHILTSNYSNTIGYLKASPDRTKLGLGVYGPQSMAGVYDFDPTTGQVSDPVEMEYSLPDDTLDGPYGVSFSPNSKYFYVGIYHGSPGAPPNNPIYQYDLSSNDSAVIVGSEIQVNPGGNGTNGALQIAPNNKIYITNVNSSNLDVINDPNNAGAACNFSDDQVTLASGMANGGLPNFVRAFKDQGTQISHSSNVLCSQDDSITLDAPPGDSVTWSTGDTGSSITVSDTGTYWVSVTDTSSSCATLKEDTVEIARFEEDLGVPDTVVCEDSTLSMSIPSAWDAPSWSTGSSTHSTLIDSGGSYWVEAERYGCPRSDTFSVGEIGTPNANIAGDTLICRNSSSVLTASPGGEGYHWSTGVSTRSTEIPGPGTYWVTVDRSGCKASDTLDVSGEDCEVVIRMPNVFSPNEDGDNDRMIPKKLQNVEALEARVYNRWGQLVHRSENKEIEWDGTTPDGQEVPEGTYYWEVEYLGKDDTQGNITGSVQLVR